MDSTYLHSIKKNPPHTPFPRRLLPLQSSCCLYADLAWRLVDARIGICSASRKTNASVAAFSRVSLNNHKVCIFFRSVASFEIGGVFLQSRRGKQKIDAPAFAFALDVFAKGNEEIQSL